MRGDVGDAGRREISEVFLQRRRNESSASAESPGKDLSGRSFLHAGAREGLRGGRGADRRSDTRVRRRRRRSRVFDRRSGDRGRLRTATRRKYEEAVAGVAVVLVAAAGAATAHFRPGAARRQKGRRRDERGRDVRHDRRRRVRGGPGLLEAESLQPAHSRRKSAGVAHLEGLGEAASGPRRPHAPRQVLSTVHGKVLPRRPPRPDLPRTFEVQTVERGADAEETGH
mmetsp:Transcript_22381/g.68927  ORF Transcript_22381/g.68927 Transcript_22381/m.68927 type:complete len:227 (+) Transcript_22381:612-1292(+)